MTLTLIDSGAFIGWLSDTDRYHRVARETYDRLLIQRVPLVTTNLVTAETCTWLSRRSPHGHTDAVSFGEYLRQNGAAVSVAQLSLDGFPRGKMAIVYSNPDIERRAWEIFEKYDTARFSFTDCVSFAVMESLKIKQAFTFDEHYDVMGFERLPTIDLSDRA